MFCKSIRYFLWSCSLWLDNVLTLLW